jgi:hypothetical protein
MALNRIIADSIADGTVVASDIADGTITLAKLQSGLLPPAIANSGAAYANAAFATANTGSASGSYANSAFASANLISGVNTTQNTNITNASTYANSAFATANTGSASGSYANSAFAKANTAGVGTVTSIETGNGLSGGTITSSGTLVIACPSYNTVGSYVYGAVSYTYPPPSQTITSGGTYSAGVGAGQVYATNTFNGTKANNLSGTWRYMGGGFTLAVCSDTGSSFGGIWCRVS